MQPTKYPVTCFGEMLWDLLPSKELPGGAPMNVAYHLKKLGTEPALLSKIGADDYGRRLVDLLAENAIPTEFLQVDHNHPTGLVYAHPDEHNDMAYDIVYPSAWDFIEPQDRLIEAAAQSRFFVFGSLTSRSKSSRNTLYQLLEAAQTRVLDINLRQPHFSSTHVEYLLDRANVLKMNISELELITGWLGTFNNTQDRINLIHERFDVETIIVTMGADGAWVSDKGMLHRSDGFKVTVTDTIGSGDAFLAGFLHQLLNGATAKEALGFASAVGAFVATQPGACPVYAISQIKELIQSRSIFQTAS